MGKKIFVGNLSFNTTSADLEALFAQHGTCAEICNHLGGRGEGVRGQQHFVPRLQADGVERQLQRGGTGINRQSVFAANISGKLFFELDGDRPGGKPARA